MRKRRAKFKVADMLCTIQNEAVPNDCDVKCRDDDILEKVRKVGRKYNIHTILPLDTKDISVAHWVRLKCKYGCQKYGKSWCCPPETPTPEKTEAMLKEYKKALLLCGRLKNSDFYKNNSKKRKINVNTWKGTVALERYLFLAGYYKAFGLVSESCALCKKCLYPVECKFPMDRRPSVESCSIDIFQTLKNIGKQFEIAKNIGDEYNCYSIILLE
jgi:predicted metal-binding protein